MTMNLRYVVLHHQGIDQPHYDLMFETSTDSELMTWRSPCWPIDRPTPLVRLADHRRHYLDYEGPISGNRGYVTRVACGLCSITKGVDQTLCIEMDNGMKLTIRAGMAIVEKT